VIRSRVSLFLAYALVVSGTILQAADEAIRVVPLVRDRQVLVSFELGDGFDDNVRAAIRSGLPTTFSYIVELRLEVPLWIDRTITSALISNTVQYDNLTRRHHLSRRLDGRLGEVRVTEDDTLVRQLMTTVDQLPLFETSKLEPNREYYVRVRAQARPRNVSFFWPWGSGPSGHAGFTFIP
jgi:hypothetical protein